MDKNKPAAVLRDGALKATIWENQGDKGVFYNATLAKTYEDKDGVIRDANSFSGSDLLRISELARQAYVTSAEMRREANRRRRQDQNHSAGRERTSGYLR